MGYLDNTSITVDAILTKRGRELLSQGGLGAFNITQFALGDDEIDYTLFNEDHPNGSQFSGEAIENMPLIEANFGGSNRENLTNRTAFSQTVASNDSIVLTALNSTSLFGNNSKLLTTLTIEGRDTGARLTIPIEVSKTQIGQVSVQGQSGISLK